MGRGDGQTRQGNGGTVDNNEKHVLLKVLRIYYQSPVKYEMKLNRKSCTYFRRISNILTFWN